MAKLLSLLCALCLTLRAQPAATHHHVTVSGKALHYSAETGLIPIRDNEAGDLHGSMFYVAYTLDRPSGAPPRPLAFVWNGGPGSNSGLVHLLGFGPRRIAPGSAVIENPDTWLAFTDLVFVDPIGTGYSRPAKPEYAAEFYQARGDAESIAEFIRVYRLRHDAYDAPLYLVGESYGVTRCALVAEILARRHTALAGVVMLSGGFPLANIANGLHGALALPTLTAAAWYHKKLPPDLQAQGLDSVLRAAEAFALGDYTAALAKPENVPADRRDALAAQVSRFTGIPAARIDRARLTIPVEQFTAELLAPANLVLGRYDSRLTGARDPSPQYDPTTDPSLKDILDNNAVVRYLRHELGYESDLNYQGPFGGGYPPATTFRGDWMSVRWNRSGPQPSPSAAFRAAAAADPSMRVMVVTGIYDLVSSYFEIEQAAAQLPPNLRARVTVRTYPGGHAIYTDDAVRSRFRQDADAFFQEGHAR
jgi:carboxypeptidase C (cathepsin A)